MNQPGKLRVLLVSTSFPLSEDAVSGIFVGRLADALASKVALEVLVPCGRQPMAVRGTSYPLHRFRYGFKSWQALTHEPGGIPTALKVQPLFWLVVPLFFVALFVATWRAGRDTDIIHANWSVTGLICALAGKLRGVPVITTLRGSDVVKLDKSALSRWVLKCVLYFSRYVVAVSRPMQQTLEGTYPFHAEKIGHIGNGVAGSLLQLPQPEPSGDLKLIAIGNLIPEKGIQDLLDALCRINKNVSLTIVGDGPARGALEQQVARLMQTERVTFLGIQPPDRIGSLLAQHQVLVLPSHAEGRPNVVVEAMAACRAVIASSLPGVAELIEDGETGLLFPPRDVDSLKNAIESLVNNPKRIALLGLAARQVIVDRDLTWSACADQYIEIYRKILER